MIKKLILKNMHFIALGSHPNISLAEIFQVTGEKDIQHSNTIAIFENLNTEITNLNSKLGGSQKIGIIHGSVKKDSPQELIDLCLSILLSENTGNKIKFGVSLYSLNKETLTGEQKYTIQKIGMDIKSELKKIGHNARLVTSKEEILSSVVIKKNNLLQRGAEFVFIIQDDEILLGETLTIQDFEDWSHRDWDRPKRDARRGMLPPKLARIMINLAGIESQEKTLLDPFCGSGTVLMEGSILKFEKLLGGDISERAVSDTKKNLKWLRNEGFKIPEFEIFKSSASELGEFIENESVDLIVTEPFLGMPREGYESAEEIQEMINDLKKLYTASFHEVIKLLKPKGRIVIASPVHYVNDVTFKVPIEKILGEIGLKRIRINDSNLIYHQKRQMVGRELFVFEK